MKLECLLREQNIAMNARRAMREGAKDLFERCMDALDANDPHWLADLAMKLHTILLCLAEFEKLQDEPNRHSWEL